MRTIVGFVVVCAALLAPAVGSATQCFKYQPAKVSVSGTVFERSDWGPPSYGEDPAHDRRERHDYIRLDKPLCVAVDPRSDLNSVTDSVTERNVRLMELSWDRGPFPNAVGRRVLLSGGLFHAFTGHHHTRVLLMVSRVEPLVRNP